MVKIVLILAAAQLVLELIFQGEINFHTSAIVDTKLIFLHGHTIFWFILSIGLTAIYTLVSLLPSNQKVQDLLTSPPISITIPSKKSFYVYTTMLAGVYGILATGSLLLLLNHYSFGFCLTDIGSFVYYTFYSVLLYRLLLMSVAEPVTGDGITGEDPPDYFSGNGPSGMFTQNYRPLVQDNDSDDELLNVGDQF